MLISIEGSRLTYRESGPPMMMMLMRRNHSSKSATSSWAQDVFEDWRMAGGREGVRNLKRCKCPGANISSTMRDQRGQKDQLSSAR
ncbi:hypothetical protein PoB_007449200 [Plakobranchus ocellatus]|uniref:Uncharacterized protein n=1 Tax=Plakobranchus ocellatus TaxID=259542 RepID=A0AAV4DUK6_9GAST|nr:hypothetical protein PoB_007449200 [Plakobranchus ocellatus]